MQITLKLVSYRYTRMKGIQKDEENPENKSPRDKPVTPIICSSDRKKKDATLLNLVLSPKDRVFITIRSLFSAHCLPPNANVSPDRGRGERARIIGAYHTLGGSERGSMACLLGPWGLFPLDGCFLCGQPPFGKLGCGCPSHRRHNQRPTPISGVDTRLCECRWL